MVDSHEVHRPVMVDRVVGILAARPGGTLLDGTTGCGGHAAAWLAAAGPDARLIGLDRDASALSRARETLAPYGSRVDLVHADYRDVAGFAERAPFSVVLLDLGLGSHQLDDPERGFSFRLDGPLDMRFDRDRAGGTANEYLSRVTEPELARVLAEFGEERSAKKLARELVRLRRAGGLSTTAELARAVRNALPQRGRDRIDPATRTFQALRIAVNDELSGLGEAVGRLVDLLEPGGRICVLAYHSLEDRAIKRELRRMAEPCRCRRGDPCSCGALETLELSERKPLRPDEAEAQGNPRARSARLRWGIKR